MANNQTVIIGRLTGDPQLRYTANGLAVTKFTIASNERRYNKQTQQWEDGDQLFQRCEVVGQQAEHTAESLQKGHATIVIGRVRTDQWETPDGQRRSQQTMIVTHIGPSLAHGTTRFFLNDGTTKKKTPNGTDSTDPWAAKS